MYHTLIFVNVASPMTMERHRKKMYDYKDIRAIHLEVTQNCLSGMFMCDRNMRGEGINPINLDELTLEDCRQIFTP